MRLAVPNPITGRHVAMYLGGFFGVIFVANFIYIWLALSTFTGEHTQNAYDKGLAYNSTLEAAETQYALPWQPKVSVETPTAQQVKIDILFDGTVPGDLTAQATLRRPTLDGYDQVVDVPRQGFGRHWVNVDLPLPGVWDLEIVFYEDGAAVYRQTRRILAP